MGLLCKMVAIVLVALWPAVTSHALLSQSGVIHIVHADHHSDDGHSEAHQHLSHLQHEEHDHDEGSHEHNGDNHAFADGDYRSTTAGKLLLKPSLISAFIAFAGITSLVQQCDHLVDSPGPAPPGSEPQILQQTWQFSNRTAIPGRAPSALS